MYAEGPKLAQELFFWSYHPIEENIQYNKLFFLARRAKKYQPKAEALCRS